MDPKGDAKHVAALGYTNASECLSKPGASCTADGGLLNPKRHLTHGSGDSLVFGDVVEELKVVDIHAGETLRACGVRKQSLRRILLGRLGESRYRMPPCHMLKQTEFKSTTKSADQETP